MGRYLKFYDATVAILSTRSAIDCMWRKWRNGLCRDVCAPEFDVSAAVSSFTCQQNHLVADAVLNQDVLPGAGNIIKNEALHRARIAPDRRVASLSDIQIRNVVLSVRDFSMQWYNAGRAPSAKVYNRTICADCGSCVKLIKHGETGLPRSSFWCPKCCDDCERTSAASVPSMASHSCIKQQLTDEVQEIFIIEEDGSVVCSSKSLRQKGKRVANTVIESMAPKRKRSLSGCVDGMIVDAPQLEPQCNLAQMSRPMKQCIPQGQHQLTASTPAMFCAKHPQQTTLKRVRKHGANTGRVFFSCKAGGCNFFAWGDTKFPQCKCAGTHPAILRISKTERTGGKWFFSCARSFAGPMQEGASSSRCDYFAWTKPEHLALFGAMLTPLL